MNNICRYEKRKYAKNILEEAEEKHRGNKIRQLYQKIHFFRGRYKKKKKIYP